MGSKAVTRAASPLVTKLRKADPDATLDTMVLSKAQQIIVEWRATRDAICHPTLAAKTRLMYEKTVRMLRAKYAAELGIDEGDLSPVEVVRRMFMHGSRLKASSWSTYRAAFLWYFDDTATSYALQGFPVDSYHIAMGVLIVVVRKPANDVRPLATKPHTRPTSIKRKHFTELLNALATQKGLLVKAQSFAIATLATGLRPGEWRDAVLRQAEPADMTIDTAHDDWLVLEVNTSKQREKKVRTLLIRSGIDSLHINQHLAFISEIPAIARSHKTDPVAGFIKRCSSIVAMRCKQIWPSYPDRWVTLSSLRSQARANFVARFGDRLANEMMGNDADGGRKFYSSKVKGHAPASPTPAVLPGKDIIRRANAVGLAS